MLGMKSEILFGNVVSSCSLLYMMFRAGSAGNDVEILYII